MKQIAVNTFRENLIQSILNWIKKYLHLQALSYLMLAALIAYLITPRMDSLDENYKEGSISTKNIKATMDLTLTDQIATDIAREKAINNVEPVYDFDETAGEMLASRVKTSLNLVDRKNSDTNETQEVLTAVVSEQFSKLMGVKFDTTEITFMKEIFLETHPDNLPLFLELLEEVMSYYVASDSAMTVMKQQKTIEIRRVGDQKNVISTDFKDFDSILTVNEAKEHLLSKLLKPARGLKGVESGSKKTFSEIISKLITPNLNFNTIETNIRKEAARTSVKDLTFNIKKGEMIVRDGERISPKILKNLEQIRKVKNNINSWLIFIGLVVLIFLLITLSANYAANHVSQLNVNKKDYLFLAIMLCFSSGFFTLSKYIGEIISNAAVIFPLESYFYLIPFSFAALLTRMVLNANITLVFSILLSLLSGLIMNNDFFFSVYTFVGCLVGASGVSPCKTRSTLVVAGVKIGFTNVAMILAITLINRPMNFLSPEILFSIGAGFIGGVAGSIIVTGLTPIVESLFGYVTDFQLLELSNMNHPVLKELIINAPGTYAHSIMVGSLVEAAAEDIGANPLLCRVGAYYHDIGKINKPLYFVENQVGINKHDKLTPRLSSLIITAHVKDGVEIAKKIKLCKPVTDIILQHHGTSRIDYFYSLALKKAEGGGEAINESDFSYPGPKPQTREAALVHLADMVQAASQSITDKTPSRLQGLIQKIINKSFTAGQLDECNLTLRDLHVVAKSFYRIFAGIYHYRIDYPEKITKGLDHKRQVNKAVYSLNKEKLQKQLQPNENLKRLGQDKAPDKDL